MNVKLTRWTTDGVMAIGEAAANCYATSLADEQMGRKLMNGCIKSGHMSVTEFVHFNFHIEGVSRALLAQLTRHRLCSFAVRSQRYCSEEDFAFVVPETIQSNEETYKKYAHLMDTISNVYKELQGAGVPNEDARMILPNACVTTIELSVNLRELIHICNERLCVRAQWEIRKLVNEMVKEVLKVMPELEPYLVPKCMAHSVPYCTEHNSCGRFPSLKTVINIEKSRPID